MFNKVVEAARGMTVEEIASEIEASDKSVLVDDPMALAAWIEQKANESGESGGEDNPGNPGY